jgi:hypothetical protein
MAIDFVRRVPLRPRWHPTRLANSVKIRIGPWWHRRAPLVEVPDIAAKRFMFVGGLHRSGT